MKKLFSLFILPLLAIGFINLALAPVTKAKSSFFSENSRVYHYDSMNKDLIILFKDFPAYSLINLKGSQCANFNFNQNEPLNVYIDNVSPATINKLDTNQQCVGGDAYQIQGDFRKITSANNRSKTLRTLDEDGNIDEIHHGPGCENASHYLGKGLYLGAGWQENTIFLPGNAGSCHIISSKKIR